ncbi:hypothetical protein, variant 2 [Verruconis gallopava]|uniref:Mediator of RNA polymerase II transcription subunit 31 n=1 Tax=Verruconis gallopava TaxID=253628 RepID=A0A0D2AHG5_9PEZI|nr:uncharacterized protein PV09_02822 [Verruconis gallopava]XP_016216231.1 hypothetical protein, variant 1 [Verruconis gallopava]XP_016216232.1 hypothetical protein, variant 2 [Verruconis gallopava]KIW06361.1 hypothetical protein PV09_02822 [Verruconis gallopava]KIW06362.1 hypothetical protein, variant 1 [Verruconis gallopava]KIW06363.1 hypothetical protein, variant 2 [Verruconis gallopava]
MASGGTEAVSETRPDPEEVDYAGFTRFEIELEFVQCLANPLYLHEIFNRNYFDQEEFINYIRYLQYFKDPKYAKYLFYPGPTLRALELLQLKSFREQLGNINFVMHIIDEWTKAASNGPPT